MKLSTIVSYITIFTLFVWVSLPLTVRAATLTDGTLLISDPRPSATGVDYSFSAGGFTTGTALECVQMSFSVNADGTGGAPAGLTTTSSTLASSTLITAGSWTVNNALNGSLRITNGTGETPNASGNVVWGGVTNGNTADTTYYATFSTYTNTDCSTGLIDSTVVTLVYKDGALVELVIEPTLTFTVNGVASSESVNGATTNQTTSATSINFGNSVTATTNGVSAHDLEVSTNAPGGYTVYTRHTGDLSSGSDIIAAHTGTNAAPTAFASAGTAAWGYTTSDSSLGGGTGNRFISNLWSGFSTTNEPVFDNTTASTGTETTRVGHQVGIAATTPAGTYQTTVIYTVASTY
jgi:hypothetical protein